MFQFDFNKSHDDNQQNDTRSENLQWYEAKQIYINENINDKINECNTKLFECNGIKLKYISTNEVIDKLKESDNSVIRAESNHSDLVTAVYEGGLKIWECTSDLLSFFVKENINLSNKKVLDLGCGAGLLGIYLLQNGAFVDFQDYNKEIIEYTTISNVLLNTKEDKLKLCRFYCGDWKSLKNILDTKYDCIVTSETIYNPENYQKLYDIFDHLLDKNGIVYLAAKTYYFGVGGGIREFEKILNKNGSFSTTIVWRNLEGVQREILKIVKI